MYFCDFSAVIMGLKDRPVENVHLHSGMMQIYLHTPAAMDSTSATAQGNAHIHGYINRYSQAGLTHAVVFCVL